MQHIHCDAVRPPRLPAATVLRSLAAMLAIVTLGASGTAWAAADLVLSQQTISTGQTVPPNTTGTVTMPVTNRGPDTATGVTLTYVIPANVSYVSATVPGGTCAQSSATTYVCNLPDLAKDATTTVSVDVTYTANGVYTNKATLSSTSTDPNSANNSSTLKVTVADAANLSITASSVASGDTVAGAAIDYTVQVQNAGSAAVPAGSAPVVSFQVPAGATITEIPSGDGWTCTPAAGSYPMSNPSSTATITCTRADDALGAGASYPEIHVPAVANVSGTVTANFGISSGLHETITDDNNASVSVDTVDGTDMAIDKTVSPSGSSVTPGSTVTYTLQASQNGGVSPTNVTIIDALPAGLTYVEGSLVAPASWQC